MSLFGQLSDASEIDASVRRRLANSLRYLHDKVGSNLSIERELLDRSLERICAHKQDPGIFARYYDLVSAIAANELSKADQLFHEIAERSAVPACFAIEAYQRETLGPDYDRFPRLLFSDYSSVNPFGAPSQSEAKEWSGKLTAALEIISRVDPAIYEEINGFLVRVYMAVDSKLPSARQAGGVSSFLLWGATFANIDYYKTPWEAVQFLVHEVTHILLFGLSAEEPLVRNSPEESYVSPLRTDPRPMDGIFHATLVCARLAAFNEAWLQCGALDAASRDKTERYMERRRRKFLQGLSTVDQHAKLSEKAQLLLNNCRTGLSLTA